MQPELNSKRRYDLDWLRVFAVFLLVPFHVALIFVSDPNSIMYVKDVVNSRVLDEAAGFVHMWHMPLFFLISGAASWYGLSSRSAGKYLQERTLRLLVPFIFGIFTFIPVTTYIHRSSQVSFLDHYLGFFKFDFEHLDGYGGSFTPAHLWFILFLFVFSLIALPLFMGLRSEMGKKLTRALSSLSRSPFSLFLWGIPLALAASLDILGDKNPVYYFLIFIFGYLLTSEENFQEQISRLTWFALGYGIFEGVFRVAVPQWAYAEWSFRWTVLGLMYEMGRWSMTLAVLGLGRRFLNFTNHSLRYASEIAMPFYLLHMTFSVVVGYVIIQLNLSVAIKYLLIVIGATGLTLLACELVKRWNFLRWLFGMRLVRKAPTVRLSAEEKSLT